jgi:hypothetical protein
VIANTREADWSQTLHITGVTNKSISCPEFDGTLEYYINNEMVHTETYEKFSAGPFDASFNVPEFFGDVMVKAIMTPREGSAKPKFANSNSLVISAEACVIDVHTTAEYYFNSLES